MGAQKSPSRRVSRRLLSTCIALVDFAGVVVPRYLRREWRREWRAEIWHRGQQPPSAQATDGGAVDKPAPEGSLRIRRRRQPVSPRRDLVARSLGAFRHAAWLRSQEWKPDMLAQDIRYAVRSLLRAPTFTIMALLTLGVGIGANTVVFGMLDSVLLRP